MARIHPLAVVSPQAEIGHNVEIGPFCQIEEDVRIGEDCELSSQCVVKKGTTLGKSNRLAEGVILGGRPQHVKAPEEVGQLIIGDQNTFREYVNINVGLNPDTCTIIGDRNYLMVGSHVGHDAKLGNDLICANHTIIGGHVVVEDRAFLSALVAVHQFSRIGRNTMVGGMARVSQDIPPFVTVDGETSSIVGLNSIGLKRAGYTATDLKRMKEAYRILYRSELSWNAILERLKTEFVEEAASHFYEFLSTTKRGILPERRAMKQGLKLSKPESTPATESQPLRKAG
ncbi:Acyl-ACP--UDP-N-acetylglucosamine O-acyltransferase [Planctomycetales bacterium 10988]|nr:Acyl-ACP--UDP-N-acetylglucosamine O-acyltransferase [Planctomycetales bacterium 10988]